MSQAKPQLDERTQKALDALRSLRCACGHHKEPEKSFCKRCRSSLPVPMRANLNVSIREGYVDFYFEAVDWLTKYTGRIPKERAQ